MKLVKLQGREVGEPHKGSGFGGYDVVFDFLSQLDELDPIRCPFRPVLLIKAFAIDSVREADQGKRSSLYVSKQCGSDPEVIFDNLGLHDIIVLKQHLLQVGDLQLSLSSSG